MAKILNIRGVDEKVAREFAAGAAIRGLTQADFLQKLLELRMEACLSVGDPGREDYTEETLRRHRDGLRHWLVSNEMLDMFA